MKRNHEASLFRITFLVLMVLLVLGNLGRVILTDRVAVYIHDGFLLLIALWTLLRAKKIFPLVKIHPWFKPFIVFLSIVLCSLLFAVMTNPEHAVIGLSYFIRFCVYAMVLPFVLYGMQKQYIKQQHILLGLISVSLGIALLGLLQYWLMPDVRFLSEFGYDDHYFRLISTLFDPPFTASVIMIGLFLILGSEKRSKNMWCIWAILFIAFLFTYSRATYISFLAGVVALVAQTGHTKKLLLIGILVVGIFLLPRPASEGARLERVRSIFARFIVLEDGVRQLTPRTLLIGNGWYMTNASRVAPQGRIQSHSSSSDNSFFHVLQSAGILGLASYLWFLFTILKQYVKNTLVFPIIIALLVGSFANNLLFYPFLMIMFWFLLSLVRASRHPSAMS